MTFFLRARSWQLLALHLGVPILVVAVFPPLGYELAVGSLVLAFYVGTYFLWLTSVVRACNRKLPQQFRRSTKVTEAGLTLLAVLTFIYLIVLNPFGGITLYNPINPPRTVMPYLKALEFTGYLLGFVLLYAEWLCARQLTILKNGRKHLGGTIGRFLLIELFPIGIWFLQPLVRELAQPVAPPGGLQQV
jgi:predicted small integral membrane protein